jgi:amino acid transporter
MLCASTTLQSPRFVFLEDGFNNETGFTSIPLVVLIGSLAAATTFTGYDTAAHISEETTERYPEHNTPQNIVTI